MNLFQRTRIVFFGMLLAFALLGSARAEVVDRIVANVNGQIILYSDLQNQIAILKKRVPKMDLSTPEKQSQIEHAVLDQLIQQKLADMEARRLKIVVSDAEVNARIQEIMKLNHLDKEQLKQKLAANGDSVANMRKQIKEGIARQELLQRVIKSQVVVTDQEVDAYLNARGGQLDDGATNSKQIRLALIELPFKGENASPAEAKKTGLSLVKKLQGGADFAALARKYSKGPAAQSGGDIGFMDPGEMAPFIAKAVEGLQKGQVSKLAQGQDGYYLVKVLDVTNKHINMSPPASREKVRQILYEQAMQHKYEQWLKKLESKAFIQISL